MNQNESPAPESATVTPPAGVELATPVSRGQIVRVALLLTVAFIVGALLLTILWGGGLTVVASWSRPADSFPPRDWVQVSSP